MLTLAALACGSHTTIDPNATGIDLAIERPAETAVDQVRLSVSVGGAVSFGPVFLPEVPRSFGPTESLVVLLDASLDGQTVHLDISGYSDGSNVATGSTDVAIKAKTLSPAAVTLTAPATAPVCGDGVCAPTENTCSCVADCPSTCGDGCCSSGEKKQNCPSDCR